MDLRLAGKVILISGAAGREGSIGRALVEAIVKEGAIPVMIDIHERGKEIEKAYQEKGITSTFIQADLTDNAQCQYAVQEALKIRGQIDGIINNLGSNDNKGFDASYEEFIQSLKLNLIHFFLLVKYSLPALKESHGNIVNIGSKVAVTGQGNTSAYAAAKGGVMALTREWALELAPFGIRSNAIMIAESWTPSYNDWVQTLQHPEQTLHQIRQLVPLYQRMTKPEEIGDLAVFLLSERSSHITGQHIHIDGGYVHLDRAVGNIQTK